MAALMDLYVVYVSLGDAASQHSFTTREMAMAYMIATSIIHPALKIEGPFLYRFVHE